MPGKLRGIAMFDGKPAAFARVNLVGTTKDLQKRRFRRIADAKGELRGDLAPDVYEVNAEIMVETGKAMVPATWTGRLRISASPEKVQTFDFVRQRSTGR